MVEVKAKTFTSSNSVALRLPKVLAMEPGVELVIRKVGDKLTVQPSHQPRLTMAELAAYLREIGPPPGPPKKRVKIIFPKQPGL